MNRTMLISLCATLAFAANAYALKVTNLDTIPHTVIYRTVGEDMEQVVEPNQAVSFHGKPDGLLSLKTPAAGGKKKPGKAQDVLHADGVLSGIVGATRSEDIPASSNYDFVIWPGGRLQVQHNRQGDIF